MAESGSHWSFYETVNSVRCALPHSVRIRNGQLPERETGVAVEANEE